LEEKVFSSRREEDFLIFKAISSHEKGGSGGGAGGAGETDGSGGAGSMDIKGRERYNFLKLLNKGRDVELELRDWAEKKVFEEAKAISRKGSFKELQLHDQDEDDDDNEKDVAGDVSAAKTVTETGTSYKSSNLAASEEIIKQLDDLPVYHYPRNATGYYRGLWLRLPLNQTATSDGAKDASTLPTNKPLNKNDATKKNELGTEAESPHVVSLDDIHPWIQSQLDLRKEDVSLLFLPCNTYLDSNATASLTYSPSKDKQRNSTTIANGIEDMNKLLASSKNTDDYLNTLSSLSSSGGSAQSSYLRQSPQKIIPTAPQTPTLSLTNKAGRAALQLYSRPIPAMTEISIVDGLVKLYDGMTSSFVSRRTDVLLRVRGVMIHGIGKLSLVTVTYSPGSDGWVAPVGGKRRSVLGVRAVKDGDVRNVVGKGREGNAENGKEEMNSVLDDDDDDDFDSEASSRHRRLQETLNRVKFETDSSNGFVDMVTQIRQDVMELYSSHYANHWNIDEHGFEITREEMQKDGWTVLHSVDEASDLILENSDESGEHRHLQALAKEVETVLDVSSAVVTGDDSKPDTNDVGRETDVTASNVKDVGSKVIVTASDVHDVIDLDDERTSHRLTLPGEVTGQNESEEDTAASGVESIDTTLIPATHRSALSDESSTSKQSVAEIYVYPFPYIHDDEYDSIRKSSSPATHRLPSREQPLEGNAANCEFEINMYVQESKWNYGEWRKSQEHRMRTVQAFNRYWNKMDSVKEIEKNKSDENEMAAALYQLKKSHFLLDFLDEEPPKEGLVMTMNGNIESRNCAFNSFVNVTAIRVNLEHTTTKAINYSFYMMLTCLTQIVVLLRQLLHTQAQSAASNVSLLCIGWQTVLDAILCIGHIFLCLVMQNLFTAFASVAFFKLLIFCVIEMKYMAIIIQARNNSNNTGQTHAELRRQITLLHLRFYGALMLAIVSFWYIGQSHRTLYVLLLYSFWVPQIVMNVITESRKPMHPYYIYGMSFTRVVAPIYTFAVESNFLKEVNPEFPTDIKMCQLLVLWIGVQTAILVLQGKYGTRFMIPQRFLPPKFDYSRPIPPSLLPRPTPVSNSNNGSPSELELGPLLNGDASPSRERGTRNRRGGGNRVRLGSRSDEATGTMSTETNETPTLDCVICYNEIDVNDRKGYMLAPCDHIFHRQCLEQWMEVKMECPICRKQLPSL